MSIRIAHLWSSDLGIPITASHSTECLERGWQVTIICPAGPRVSLAESLGMIVHTHQLGRRLEPLADVREARRIYALLKRGGYDIVHTHNVKTGLIGRALATQLKVPVVVHTIHGLVYGMETPFPKRQMHAVLERFANRGVDGILVQSQEDEQILRSTHALGRAKVFSIGNGVNLEGFDPDRVSAEGRRSIRQKLGIREEDVLFFSAGRLVREKGFLELFDAAVRARELEPRIRLAVAGEADLEKIDGISSELLAEASQKGILLLGSRSDMFELYAASDVVCLMSWREGLPRVLMEGAVMGKALLAANSRGLREVVEDGKNGLLVGCQKVDEIMNAMLRLARDPLLRSQLGGENRRVARTRYDLAKVVGRIMVAYDTLLKEKGYAIGWDVSA